VRSSTGRFEDVAAWSLAVILRECIGSTRGSFAPVTKRTAGYRRPNGEEKSSTKQEAEVLRRRVGFQLPHAAADRRHGRRPAEHRPGVGVLCVAPT
jgi:hypothetical protein